MSRSHVEQSISAKDIFEESTNLTYEFLERRQEFSEQMLSLILEKGGITYAENEFTVAMHGFSREDLLGRRGSEIVLDKYDEISRRFEGTYEQPVARFMPRKDGSGAQRLVAIGRIPFSGHKGSSIYEAPLQYRIHHTNGMHVGRVELPVEQLHQWEPAGRREADAILTVQDKATLTVAHVTRTVHKYGSLVGSEHAVNIDDRFKVGWHAIMSHYVFGEAYPDEDQIFLDRIQQARADFHD